MSVAGQQTVVGPGPAPPSLSDTDTGGRIVRAGHKRYFFDLGSNQKGAFLRITEVRGGPAPARGSDIGPAQSERPPAPGGGRAHAR